VLVEQQRFFKCLVLHSGIALRDMNFNQNIATTHSDYLKLRKKP
jgi:hypothetical protein